jgi:hypothetical protein
VRVHLSMLDHIIVLSVIDDSRLWGLAAGTLLTVQSSNRYDNSFSRLVTMRRAFVSVVATNHRTA